MKIPKIETKRLILRAHELSDFPEMNAMWADPIVTLHIGGQPSTTTQVWSRLCSYLGHWSLMGFGFWAIEERESGRFVGELGFANFRRELDSALDIIPEMGWALVPSVHGKGYATEVIQAALNWGSKNLKSKQTACIIDPGNAASLALAKKFNFIFLKDAQIKGSPVKLFIKNF